MIDELIGLNQLNVMNSMSLMKFDEVKNLVFELIDSLQFGIEFQVGAIQMLGRHFQ